MLELHDAPSTVRPAISAIDAGREIPLEQRMSPIVPFSRSFVLFVLSAVIAPLDIPSSRHIA
jgi:hypothetical protein